MNFRKEISTYVIQHLLPLRQRDGGGGGLHGSGLGVTDGGARYNSMGFTAPDIGNVADSMSAIKKLIFDDEKVTALKLYDAQEHPDRYENRAHLGLFRLLCGDAEASAG